jgi:hypothetical protein
MHVSHSPPSTLTTLGIIGQGTTLNYTEAAAGLAVCDDFPTIGATTEFEKEEGVTYDPDSNSVRPDC